MRYLFLRPFTMNISANLSTNFGIFGIFVIQILSLVTIYIRDICPSDSLPFVIMHAKIAL